MSSLRYDAGLQLNSFGFWVQDLGYRAQGTLNIEIKHRLGDPGVNGNLAAENSKDYGGFGEPPP